MTIGYHWLARPMHRPAAIVLTRTRRRAALPLLAKREHPLLRETDGGGHPYVATERALYRRLSGESAWQRIAWTDVAAVEYSQDTQTLTLRAWPEADVPTTDMRVVHRSRLPDCARERVTACQIVARRVDIAEGCTVIVTALREAGADTATWAVRLDPDCDCNDPAIAPAINYALRELRAQTGC